MEKKYEFQMCFGGGERGTIQHYCDGFSRFATLLFSTFINFLIERDSAMNPDARLTAPRIYVENRIRMD